MAWYDFIIRCTACGRARVRRAVLSSGCAAARRSPLAATPAAFTAVHGIPCVRARLRRPAVRRRRVLTHRRTPRRQDVALPDADADRRIDIRARPAARLCAGGLPVARRARRAAAAARHRVRRRTPRRRADDQQKRARRSPRPLRGLEPTWRGCGCGRGMRAAVRRVSRRADAAARRMRALEWARAVHRERHDLRVRPSCAPQSAADEGLRARERCAPLTATPRPAPARQADDVGRDASGSHRSPRSRPARARAAAARAAARRRPRPAR
ncbi:major facilitator superfamily MFS_1 [Burkholderia pseudomallei]|nr:major facilitator superfamily MFS_1 [Burkholderia pseudomallei]